MMALLTTLILLPLIRAEYQELKLIKQLNNFYNFDHNMFLLNELADVNRFISEGRHENHTPQSVYVYHNIGGHITGFETLKTIESKSTFLIVVVKDTQFETNINLLNQVKKIQRLQVNMKIGVFFATNASSDNDLRKLFLWSWENKIINIFAGSKSCANSKDRTRSQRILNIFTYNPFETFTVLNLTDSDAYEMFFINQSTNLKGHLLLLGAPFSYYNNKQMWLAVFWVLNATYKVVANNYTAISDFFENGIDFVPRIFFNENPTEMNMYPMDVIPMVILVPEALPYSAFAAYIQTIISVTFFGYSSITIIGTVLLLGIVRYIQQKKILVFQSLTDVLNLLMNDNGSIKYQKLSLVEIFLIVPLTFMGFVIVNGILSHLISYLTKPILQPQIDTIEDIYRSNNRIFLWSELWQRKVTDMLTIQLNRTDWSDRVIMLDGVVLNEQFTRFNRSVSLLQDVNYSKCLLRVQKRLNIKGYYIAHTYAYQYLLSYPINHDFPFTERFNEIVHWIVSTGLYDRWLHEAVGGFEADVIRKNLELLKNRVKPDIDEIPIPMFIVYGWITSIIVFFVEIFWKKISKL